MHTSTKKKCQLTFVFLTKDPPPTPAVSLDIEFDLLNVGFSLRPPLLTGVVSRLLGSLLPLLFNLNLGIFIVLNNEAKRPPLPFLFEVSSNLVFTAEAEVTPAPVDKEKK